MTNVMIAGVNSDTRIGTIGASGTLSEEFDLGNWSMLGLMMRNATVGTLTFWVSEQSIANGGTPRQVYNSDGTVYSITLPTGNSAFSASVVVNAIAPYRYVRVGTSTAQTNSPTVQFIVKP